MVSKCTCLYVVLLIASVAKWGSSDDSSMLKDHYNFTYSVSQPLDQTFGTDFDNGSWSGMIGMILRNESDMGICPFTYTFERRLVVDFTIGHYEESASILIPPPAEETKLYACFRPFRSEVWIGLMCALLLLPLILWMLSKCSHRIRPDNSQSLSLKHYYTFVYGIVASQSGQGSRLNSSNTIIILALMWCLIGVVLNNGYVGTLASFLSVPKLNPIIFSLEDLPSSGLTWGVRRGTDLDSLFTEATEGIYKSIGEGLRRNPQMLTTSDHYVVERVINGSSAYIRGRSLNEVFIDKDYQKTGLCRMSLAEREFFKTQQGFVLPKDSLLKPLFDAKIQQMIESGLTQYWRKKHWPSVRQCNPTLRKFAPRSLSLGDLQSALLIWGLGTGLAAIAFITEHAISIFAPSY